MQFDEQRDQVTVERVLRVVFLDPERANPVRVYFSIRIVLNVNRVAHFPTHDFLCVIKALEKLKRQLAEADAALESRKKPPADTGPRVIGEGLVIDEWVSIHYLCCPISMRL